MKTFPIVAFNSNIDVNRNKNGKILKSASTLKETTVIPANFLFANDFIKNKKNYLKSVENKDIFTKEANFTNPENPLTSTKKASSNNLSFGNIKKQISFTGITDKLAHLLSPTQLENLQNFVNGADPKPEEIKKARSIIRYKLKDWPKGITDPIIVEYHKPSTERGYHELLLKQLIKVPPEPPMTYRMYQRWFNTKTWKQIVNTLPEYVSKVTEYERMESIIKKERIKSYEREKALLDKAAKKELSVACVKYQINEEFLPLFNSDNPNVNIPGALMIQSKSKKDAADTLKWIVSKSNSNYIYIKDNKESNYTRLDQIFTVLEEGEKNYKRNGKRTLIWIENFNKLLSNEPDNEEVIGDLKDILDKISKQYKTTVIFSCQNTKKLNPIVLQPHRVKIYNLDKEAPLEELQKIQNNYILSNIQQIKNTDGYRFKYLPFRENYVDLYLGDFSYNPKVLWADTQNSEAIAAVIKNFDIIKTISKFKNIKSIQFPKPNNLDKLDKNKLNYTGKITKDGKVICEYFV